MSDPDRGSTPTLVLISRVWAVAGALALVIALVTRSPVVAVFGGLALVAAGILFGIKSAQDRSVQRNDRVTGASMPPPPPTRASDILGRRREQPPRPQPQPRRPATDEPATDEPADEPAGEGAASGPDLRKEDDETAPVDPASTRRTGPRRRPEPGVPSTARNRGRRNPTAGRDTGPFPAQSGAEGPGDDEPEVDEDPDDETDETDVVDEPAERREADDAEIDDAETVDEPGHH